MQKLNEPIEGDFGRCQDCGKGTCNCPACLKAGWSLNLCVDCTVKRGLQPKSYKGEEARSGAE